MKAPDDLIVLATGGTGGHVFPAQALAAVLSARGHRIAVVTDGRGAAFGSDVETHRVRAATVTSSVRGLLEGGVNIGIGTLQALRLLRQLRPAMVVGFGGYPSVPTLLAARWLGVPTLIHEQNAVLGRANRLLAGRVDHIATSFHRVEALPAGGAEKVVHTGNPVRPAVAAIAGSPYDTPVVDAPLRVMVLGGSQGARVFSEVIPEALNLLPEPLRQRLRLSQQCRPEDLDAVRAAYSATGVTADLASFFDDVPQRLRAAHLVIARAGASTIAELTAVGRPAILVPYPFAMDDHQTVNAQLTDETGGAWLIPQRGFSAATLAARLETLMTLPSLLEIAAAKARETGRPDAAERLADLVERSLATARDARAAA